MLHPVPRKAEHVELSIDVSELVVPLNYESEQIIESTPVPLPPMYVEHTQVRTDRSGCYYLVFKCFKVHKSFVPYFCRAVYVVGDTSPRATKNHKLTNSFPT